MTMRSVEELKNIRGKRVLVRVDFNVHIEKGKVMDDTRIAAAVPTIEFLIKKGAKVVLMSHDGCKIIQSPRGSLRMTGYVVVKRLSELLKEKVPMAEKWDFARIHERVQKMKAGEVLMLPNLRLHPGEEKNSAVFARELAGLADMYVNEAFSVCHRKHASVIGVPKLLPSYGGLHITKEIKILQFIISNPQRPFIVLMGGAKVSDKIGMMQAMVKRADAVLVGGALANHFFKAMGYELGASKLESAGVRLAKGLLKNKKIVLPSDVVVGTRNGEKARVVEVDKVICEKPYSIWDIGPKTILEFARHIKSAKTLVWNGPMGFYEVKRFSHSTLALGRLFAARSKGKAFGVIGGGETIDAMKQTGMAEYVDFISTGGGAMLEFLGGKKLPGIEALQYGSKQ